MALSDNHPLWRSPKHHMDIYEPHEHVHWMELFFDLIHVVTVFMLGNFLADQHNLPGFIVFVLIFSAIWLAWAETSVYSSLYVSADWKYLIVSAFQTLSVLFVAASIPAIDLSFTESSQGFSYFLVAYGFGRFILGIMYLRASHSGTEPSSLAKEQSFRLFGLTVLYFVAACLPAPINLWLFVFGVLITQVFYFIPKLTVMRLARFKPRFGHFTERFALMLLIVNGEGFFKLVVTLSDKGIHKVGFETLTNVAVGGLAIFALTWIYFDFVGHVKPREEKQRYLYAYWVGHMTLMMAAVIIGVALAGEVYVGFTDPYPIYYGTLGSLGLVLYLLSIMTIQWSIERQTVHRFAKPTILGFGILIALVNYAVFPYIPSFFGNLLWASAVLIQLIIPVVTGYNALSIEHEV